ncbi:MULTISPECIES: hypothetical protein [Methylorubrum]|jgi:hypothetical protein|uniref:Uncharacterized protein n=2 Tax=Methylorubrum extorquens TaxID=408 RepID=C5AUE8_METEA|nr:MULTISPECIES: hypothetical protein [Methylorubrum]ACS38538.1 hypothetical protein MexAM1_META1p0608 [Methylorubrum extorquens AM1]EHP92895.1 hypothetical protein MetexDRAFT_2194 [Methylorubrum extorquens DSM 13060]MCP1543394.1 hypothetical protein [Methylorubrum extorquens]MCP1589261.1 hypothetical protein [Methylorubrum extorquens]BDL38095.1 hypothetical protein MSPGM_06850 [Methylorubrum sp. GM97]
MAHILTFPNASHVSAWPSRADTLSSARDGSVGLAGLLAAFDAVLESVRLAWWDGSSLGLSRGGLESLVGLEPGDATPPRLIPVEARAQVQA